ncbi:hypothetical protein RvY_12809 [Ramazzottius varieornatus]|uniref:FH2 domain-containing protein n=1 Tax=Ramazzottius varieornatus TaxID=947166 RepID=A0A1D1VKS0_RAMVA|nr:hypothetical protein RvY_12809 [Ramazzottius varieornatus]
MRNLKVDGKRLDAEAIKQALYDGNTGTLTAEIVNRLDEMKATSEELTSIRNIIRQNSNDVLDTPERLLLDLASITHFESRVACLKVLHSFEERLSILSTPIVALQEVLERLSTSESVKRIFGIILSYGNYMNGGNRTREQADGFQIDLLTSLKNCKSKNQQVTLLHLVIQTYIEKFERDTFPDCAFPVPETAMLKEAGNAEPDSTLAELKETGNLLKKISDMAAVISRPEKEPSEHVSTGFDQRMAEFLQLATTKLEDKISQVNGCKDKFREVTVLLQWQAKGKNEVEQIKEFMQIWIVFSTDFSAIWKDLKMKRISENQAAKRKMQHAVQLKQQQSVHVGEATDFRLRMSELKRKKESKASMAESPSRSTTPSFHDMSTG